MSFVGTLTFGNAPYPFLGYGLLSFSLFLLPYVLQSKEAVVSFFAGMVLGVIVDLRTQSLFAVVGIGAVVVRSVQFVLLLRLREKHGFLAPTLLVLVVGTLVALFLSALLYGAEGLQPAYAILDAVYLVPAYLVIRLVRSPLPRPGKAFGVVSVVGGTLGVFFSASAFLVVAPLAVAVGLIVVGSVLARGVGAGARILARPGFMALASIIAGSVLVATFALSGPAAQLAMRATMYPMYGDSLGATQWIQTSSAAGCRPGNLVGGGTETNGVWGHARLRVLSTCAVVRGVIESVAPSSGPIVDGDYSLDLRLDSDYSETLSLGSGMFRFGRMHVEVVPSDQPVVLGNISLAPGAHVQVTGVWVLDTDHGWWSEIHPAWSIDVLSP